MQRDWYRDSLTGAIRYAFEQVSELTWEMEEVSENTPEPLQRSELGECRSAAACMLGMVNEPTVPTSLRGDEHLVEWMEMTGGKLFRPARRDNVVSCLEACVAYLSTKSNDDATGLKKELQKAIDDLKEIYFPPMYLRSGRLRRTG
jgi:hypothetical protein